MVRIYLMKVGVIGLSFVSVVYTYLTTTPSSLMYGSFGLRRGSATFPGQHDPALTYDSLTYVWQYNTRIPQKATRTLTKELDYMQSQSIDDAHYDITKFETRYNKPSPRRTSGWGLEGVTQSWAAQHAEGHGQNQHSSLLHPKSVDRYEPISGEYMQQQQQTERLNSYLYNHRHRRRYKPVRLKLPDKPKKKMKILSLDKGFSIPGGLKVFGKFKSLKSCMKACASSPTCFAGDFNEWLGSCHVHENLTACQPMETTKGSIHFKKVPCTVPEAPQGQVILGAQLHYGLEQKTIDDLATCIHKCATLGAGIQDTNARLRLQRCYGVDYDFAQHKCYFHVRNFFPPNRLCGNAVLQTPRDLVENHSTVFIQMCPG